MRLLRGLALLCALVGSLWLVSPALATFPGRNGQLVLQPQRGGGLLVVGAKGNGQRRICTNSLLCGAPSAPHASPDGRSIVFLDGRSKVPAVVAPDGTCLWCLLGSPFSKLIGSAPAFMANGLAITLLSGGTLERAPLTGGSAAKLRAGPITQPAWSKSGALAYVRAGWIWLVPRGGTPRRLTPGAVPDFSPSGGQIVFTRSGWIWAVGTRGGTPQRLVRGAAPVLSPDGHKLAFIRFGRVYVAGARGRGARAVPGVRARALDWQPIPRSARRPCAVPGGSSVVAQNALAVVTRNPGTPFTPWYGCLQAVGKRVRLLSLPAAGGGYNASLAQVRLSGRFAAVTLTSTDQYGNCANTVDEVDLSTGKTTQLYAQNCSTSARSVDSLVLDTSGFVAWHARELVTHAQALIGVSCPSTNLCVAVDGRGNVFSSTNPSGGSGAWSLNHVAPAFTGIKCPSTSLCIGLDGGNILTTTSPTSGAWSALTPIDAHPLAGVDCPSTGGLCVAVDSVGNAVWSSNPSGGTPAWQTANIAGNDFLTGVACPSISLCIAVGQHGDVLTTTSPSNGESWNRSTAENGVSALTGVTCPSVTECVATDSAGNVLTTSDPANAAPAWTVTHVAPSSLSDPACASTCVVKDAGSEVFASANPTASNPSWTGTQLVTSPNALTSVGGCERTQFGAGPGSTAPCVATDENGNVIVSSDPASGNWRTTAVDVPSCGACISEQVWAHDDEATQVLDQALLGSGNVLGNLGLAGNATTLTWTRRGAPERAPLR